jgi:3D (Asp-Asp-Asp) domain-containing protein
VRHGGCQTVTAKQSLQKFAGGRVGAWSLLILLLLPGQIRAQEFSAAGPHTFRSSVYSLKNTYYYVALEQDSDLTLPRDTAVRTLDGRLLAQVSRSFKRAMDMEGTAKLLDGRVLNYAGVVEREVRYAETIHPHGRGVGDCALVPLRSVAVDRTRIPLGSLVYIAETDGKRLPDGSLHDGLWQAIDVGGAIKEARIDLFTGEGKDSGKILAEWGIRHMQVLRVRVVEPPAPQNCTQETPR